MSAGATVFATGLTGCTVSSGSFGLVFLAVGDGVDSGRSNGSEAGFSVVVVVFCDCFPVLRGRVVCAVRLAAVRRRMALIPRNVRKRVDLLMMARDCIRERLRLKAQTNRFPRDNSSDAGNSFRFACCPICLSASNKDF